MYLNYQLYKFYCLLKNCRHQLKKSKEEKKQQTKSLSFLLLFLILINCCDDDLPKKCVTIQNAKKKLQNFPHF